MNRRDLLSFASGAAAAALPLAAQPGAPSGPSFFDVRKHGATGDGATLDTAAINRAVDACHAAGGGVVYMPPGVYHSGTVLLRSNVTLYLEAGATLLGSKNLADYAKHAG